jgi:hypothetical protein
MKLRLLTTLEDQVMLSLSKLGSSNISQIASIVAIPPVSYRKMYDLLHRLKRSGLIKKKRTVNGVEFKCSKPRKDYLTFYMNSERKGYFDGTYEQLISYLKKFEIYREDYPALLKISIISEKYKEKYPARETTYYESDRREGVETFVKRYKNERAVIGRVFFQSRQVYGVLFQSKKC